MKKNEIMIIADYSNSPLSLQELCESCHITAEVVQHFVEYQIVHPKDADQQHWQFELDELKRVKKALRMQHDLEMNLAGVAVVLDLLDQLEALRNHVQVIKKHYLDE